MEYVVDVHGEASCRACKMQLGRYSDELLAAHRCDGWKQERAKVWLVTDVAGRELVGVFASEQAAHEDIDRMIGEEYDDDIVGIARADYLDSRRADMKVESWEVLS